jgi:hypothetical protein
LGQRGLRDRRAIRESINISGRSNGHGGNGASTHNGHGNSLDINWTHVDAEAEEMRELMGRCGLSPLEAMRITARRVVRK